MKEGVSIKGGAIVTRKRLQGGILVHVKGKNGEQGEKGENAVLVINWKGVWTAGTYAKDDFVVAPDNNGYICISDSTTQQPALVATDWRVMNKGGVNGTHGINGKDGKDGTNGKDGKDGANGTNGKSAFELAVEGGYTGNEAQFKAELVNMWFFSNTNVVSTMASLPISKMNIVVFATSATAWSFASIPPEGSLFQILLKSLSYSDFVQAIPNTGSWSDKNETTVTVKAGSFVELSCWYIDSKYIVIIREP